MTDKPIIIEQLFNASIESVWLAITELRHMHYWFFENIEAFKPEVGFETQFIVQSGGRVFLHLWKITSVKSLKKITYNWKYQGYPGNSYVTFELFEEPKGTLLRLTHITTESFPDDIPEFKRESGIEGWTYFIKKRLKEFLDSQKT